MSQISYRMGLLRIKPTEPEKALKAIRDELIGWRKKGEELQAVPLLLPYRHAHELFPNLEEDEDSILGEFAQIQQRLREGGFHPLKNASHLFKVQVKPTKILASRSRALVTGVPGTGKTVITLTALAQKEGKDRPEFICIVCPLSLIDGWRSELEAWFLGELRAKGLQPQVYVWRNYKEVKPLPGLVTIDGKIQMQILITTPQTVYGLYDKNIIQESVGDRYAIRSWLIIDESFYFKNRRAGRSMAALELAQYFKNIWALSGMPISRFSDDLFFQLKILYPEVFTSYWKFAKRYCLIDETPWGDKIVGDRKGALDLLRADLPDILIEGEFPEEVPDWQPEVIRCALSGPQKEVYLKLRDELVLELKKKGETEVIPLTSLISLTTYLNKAASNLALFGGKDRSTKENTLLKLIQERPLPALIWVQYKETASRLMSKLSQFPFLKLGMLTGDTKPKFRQSIVDAFQKGELNCLILNPGVGKYGFTLTAARTAYYLENTFDGEAFYQSLFRARRIVSTHPVNLVFLLASLNNESELTIDEVIYETIKDRSENAQRLTVGKLIGTL